MDPTTAIIAGLTMIAGSFILLKLARAKVRTSGPTVRQSLNEFREREEVENNLQQLVIDIQDLTRKNIATLDTKMRLLQQLIIDADARIKVLQGAAAVPESTPPESTLHQKVYELADRGFDAHRIGRELNMERGEVELVLGLRKMKT